MTKKLMTPWFPPEVRPVRSGYYQAEDGTLRGDAVFYCFWNGVDWHYGHGSMPEAREFNFADRRWNHWQKELKGWRGLVRRPK